MQYKIRYGGSVCDSRELNAITKSVKQSIKSGGWQAGEEARLMEKEASEYLGVKYGILTSSGSCAGLLALSALELPKGSEVIISAVTFPTIFNIIIQCGLTPVVVDAKIGTYNLDVDEVEKAITPRTRAIIAIHALGNPVDMPKLMKVVGRVNEDRKKVALEENFNLGKIYVIEDNCDGWGSSISKKRVGSFGDISITSFHAAHIVSMGVGGGVFCNDKKIAQRVRMYRDWGRQAEVNYSENKKWKTLPKDYNPRFIYEKIGYNFQILELQAAMGRVQLRKTEEIKGKRQDNFNYLYYHLSKYPLILPHWMENASVCWFSFPITYQGDRGKLLKHLEKAGIETRPMFAGNITRHPAYLNSPFGISGELKGADYIMKHSFWISSHPSLTKKQLKTIVKTFDDFFKKTIK